MRLLREPLVHFAAIAALIFGAYAAFSSREPHQERVLRLSAAEVARLAALYEVEAGAPPDAAEMAAILADHVETLALAAEARLLGLDDGDAIVERRLAQKMRFTLDDLAEIAPPDEATLKAWIALEPQRFEEPARYSFDQVFFRDPDPTRLAATRAALEAESADWRTLGDAFMLGRQAGELPAREIARRFGRDFAAALVDLRPGPDWHGPIRSAFGAHLVRLTAKTAPRTPPFEALRERAAQAWLQETRRARAAEAAAALVARYKVEVEKPAAAR